MFLLTFTVLITIISIHSITELHKWAGEQDKATKQKKINDRFKAAIERQVEGVLG